MIPLFSVSGLHILAGGQFGSEGKGLLASWLAEQADLQEWPFQGVITSAGPNSGHTSHWNGEKIVLKQLPTFAVHMYLRGHPIPVYFSAGAIIDDEILMAEHLKYPDIPIFVHPCATMVRQRDRDAEKDPKGSIFAVAGTRSGTGSAIASKIKREPNAIYFNHSQRLFPYYEHLPDIGKLPYFMEISQGFSLGINSHPFYPKVTSRECTFMQGMADARIAPIHYSKGYLCFRTYPIRVGNADGYSSGDWYPDQQETTWEDIHVTPEITTVTKRIRRVATFSWEQFYDAIRANEPSHVFLNFLNYLGGKEQVDFGIKHTETRHAFNDSYDIITGHGPGMDQVKHTHSPRVKGV